MHISNLMAIAGLATVALAVTGSVLLAVSYVERGLAVRLIASLTALTFAWLWFALPFMGLPATSGRSGGGGDRPHARRHEEIGLTPGLTPG